MNLKQLRCLSLFDTGLGEKGISTFALVLPNLQNLTELCLDMNNIGDEGIILLTHAISKLSTLNRLSLYDVGMGDKGLETLINIDLSKLIVLEIGCNSVTEKSVQILLNAILKDKLSNLSELHCMYNNLSEPFKEKARKALRTYRPVLKFRFDPTDPPIKKLIRCLICWCLISY